MTQIDSSALPVPRVRTAAALWSSSQLDFRLVALFALLFLAGAEAGRVLSFPAVGFSTFWPPAAIYLAALLIRPHRDWAWLALGGALPASLAYYALHGRPLVLALAVFVANTLSATFGALLLERSGSLSELFRSARSCLRSFVLLLFANVPGALVGTAALEYYGHGPTFFRTALVWWASGTVALFVLVPPIVVSRDERPPLEARRRLELVFAFGALLAVAATLFLREIDPGTPLAFPYWVLPFLLWIAVRFGRRGAGLAGFLLTAVAAWGTVHGLGPFFVVGPIAARAVVLQTYLAIFATVAFSMAASVRSREIAVEALEKAMAEIRTLQGLIPICANCRRLRDDAGSWKSIETYFAQNTDALLTHGLCPECIHELYPEVEEEMG